MVERTYVIEDDSILCLECQMRSFEPVDIKLRYCGFCNEFHLIKELMAELQEWRDADNRREEFEYPRRLP